jgi:hypothetical protein
MINLIIKANFSILEHTNRIILKLKWNKKIKGYE